MMDPMYLACLQFCATGNDEHDRIVAHRLAELELHKANARALLNTIRIWMKNHDRRPDEEAIYTAIRLMIADGTTPPAAVNQ